MRNRKFKTPLLERHYLPPDLWSDVLARLPPKTLLRFRCVCKSWCTLIDSRDFIDRHLILNHNNCAQTQLLVEEKVPKTCFDKIFTIRRSDTFRKIALLVKNPESRMVYRSFMIHGLMLMDCHSELSLWNPSIQKSVILPLCPLKYSFLDARCFLGFAPTSNDYKVVSFKVVDRVAFVLGIAIYSLHGHYWRIKHNRINVPRWCFEVILCRERVVFCQGTMYWRPSRRRWRDQSTELLCFDFDAEEFCYLKLPDMEEEMFRFLFVFGGSLAVLGISSVRSCIWVMEKNGGKEQWRQHWKKDTCLDVYEFCNKYSYAYCEILYINDTGNLLIQSFKKLMVYNIINNQTHCLGKTIPLTYVETYVESLVLHKGFKGTTLTSHA